jgi:hypothetical protein
MNGKTFEIDASKPQNITLILHASHGLMTFPVKGKTC